MNSNVILQLLYTTWKTPREDRITDPNEFKKENPDHEWSGLSHKMKIKKTTN